MDLKALNKQKKVLFSMARHSDSHHELKKTKKIRARASKKHDSSSINISSSDSYSPLSSDRDWDKIIHPDEHKDTNKLDHVGTNNINNKDQCNYDK